MTKAIDYNVDLLVKRLQELKANEMGIDVRLAGRQYKLTSVNKDEIDNGESTGVVLNLTPDD